jgi:hypothetical protein
MHVQSLDVPGSDAEPSPEPDMEALTELVERAINGVELPDYAGVPDSRAPAGPPTTLVGQAVGHRLGRGERAAREHTGQSLAQITGGRRRVPAT